MLAGYCRDNFVCPADNELAPIVGSSYDWRDTADASTTLAGRVITDCGRPSLIIAFEACQAGTRGGCSMWLDSTVQHRAFRKMIVMLI